LGSQIKKKIDGIAVHLVIIFILSVCFLFFPFKLPLKEYYITFFFVISFLWIICSLVSTDLAVQILAILIYFPLYFIFYKFILWADPGQMLNLGIKYFFWNTLYLFIYSFIMKKLSSSYFFLIWVLLLFVLMFLLFYFNSAVPFEVMISWLLFFVTFVFIKYYILKVSDKERNEKAE